jgi:hypothetical protein
VGSISLAINSLICSISFKYLTDLSPVAARASRTLIPSNSFYFASFSSFNIFAYSVIARMLVSLLNS